MGNSVWSVIIRNWKVVLLSFVGATTFWFFNALGKDYTARITYPLEFSFQRDDVVVVDPLPSDILIDVSSGGWNLLSQTFLLSVQPIVIELDNPTDIKFLTRSSLLPIVSDQLSRLDVNYLFTDTLRINIEPKDSIAVSVLVDSLMIDVASNYRMTSPITTNVDSITIVGPTSIIQTISSPYFIAIDENRIDNNYSKRIPIDLEREDLMNAYPDEIRVSFEVERFDRETMEISIEPINFPEDSSRYVNTSVVEASYVIKRSEKEEFSQSDFMITVDFKMLDPSDSTVEVIVVYQPQKALDLYVEPQRLKVIYAK